MNWTPYDLKIILHHHSFYEPFEYHHAPAYPERIKALMEACLIEYQEGIPRTTPLGDAFIELLLQTPIPVSKYVDPRFENHAS